MGGTFSSPYLTVAYADPTEDTVSEEGHSTNDLTTSSWLQFPSRRTAPHHRNRALCENEAPILPIPYAGLHEVLKDFDILNIEDINNKDEGRPIQLRRRVRELRPIKVKETKGTVMLRAQGIITLTPAIGGLFLVNLIDVSDSLLTFIPDSIGQLEMLEQLNLANNRISSLPDTIGRLRRLRYINLERNQLKDLPRSFELLKKLRRVQIGHNLFDRVPECVACLPKLINLCVKNNYGLKWLPGRLAQLPRLHFIEAMGCDLFTNYNQALIDYCDEQSSRMHSISLFELCLRKLVLHRDQVPEHFLDMIKQTVQMCEFCNGPFFWYSISRARIIRNQSETLCLIYRMCKVHWTDDASRVKALFRDDLDPVYGTEWMDAYKCEDLPKTAAKRAYNFQIM